MKEKKEINIEIGEQVKAVREQARLTQEQLAETIGVSPQYISDLERGVVGISLATLKRLCIELSVSSDRILFGIDKHSNAEILVEKCKILSAEQVSILTDIINGFIKAIKLEQERNIEK